MATEKQRIPLYVDGEMINKIKMLQDRLDLKNRQEVIVMAINELFSNEVAKDDELIRKLSKTIIAPLKATIEAANDDVARTFYKLAIEQTVSNYILANALSIENDTLSAIRSQAIKDVKQNNGMVSLVKATRMFKDDE